MYVSKLNFGSFVVSTDLSVCLFQSEGHSLCCLF